MFARARIFANLTPLERAVLKLIEGLLLSAAVAGLQAVAPYLSGGTLTPAQLGAALHTFVVASVMAFLASALKYARAFGDPPLPVAGPNPNPAPFAPSFPAAPSAPAPAEAA